MLWLCIGSCDHVLQAGVNPGDESAALKSLLS
jgi:hypothetical protein